MFRNRIPMSNVPLDDLDRDDYFARREPDGTGGENRVTRFSDGSSRVDFVGPCGSVSYDANGEEC